MMKQNQIRARCELECARRGWTLARLAREAHKSPQSLNDILSNDSPRLGTVDELAQALGMTLSQFLEPVTAQEYGAACMPQKEQK